MSFDLDRTDMQYLALSSFLIMRFFAAALLNPKSFGLVRLHLVSILSSFSFMKFTNFSLGSPIIPNVVIVIENAAASCELHCQQFASKQ